MAYLDLPAAVRTQWASAAWTDCLANGWSDQQLIVSMLAAIESDPHLLDSPKLFAARLRTRADDGPRRYSERREAIRIGQPLSSIDTADAGLRAAGIGRTVNPHTYRAGPLAGYCDECQLPARNRIHE